MPRSRAALILMLIASLIAPAAVHAAEDDHDAQPFAGFVEAVAEAGVYRSVGFNPGTYAPTQLADELERRLVSLVPEPCYAGAYAAAWELVGSLRSAAAHATEDDASDEQLQVVVTEDQTALLEALGTATCPFPVNELPIQPYPGAVPSPSPGVVEAIVVCTGRDPDTGACDQALCIEDAVSDCSDFMSRCRQFGHDTAGTSFIATCTRTVFLCC